MPAQSSAMKMPVSATIAFLVKLIGTSGVDFKRIRTDLRQTKTPGLVIWMDLVMPVMGGKEATRQIRALDGGQDVKIVTVSASAFASEREEVLGAGIDDFVRKPFQPSEIYDCMARHLGLQRIYKRAQEEQTSVLTPEDLRELSPDLIRALTDVIVTLDQRRILEVIARVSDSDAILADKLTYFADRFSYTPIIEAVRNRGKKAS